MGRTHPKNSDVEYFFQKSGDFVEKEFFKINLAAKQKQIVLNQKAARKRAKKLGLNSIKNMETMLRSQMNERIIQEVKRRKITHAEVANISLTSRSRITAIMNRHLEDVTMDLLVRVLAYLGVSASIDFKS